MIKLLPLYLICLLSLPFTAVAQITLKGKVVDEQGEGIAFVSLGIEGTEFARLSDSQGNFEIDIPSREQKERITFHVPGYQTVSYAIDSLAEQGQLTITLREAIRQLKSVEVKAKEKLKTRVRGNKGLVIGDNKITFVHTRQFGVKVNVPNNTAELHSISFHVTNDSSITFTVRPFAFQVEEGKIMSDKNLITENRHFTFTTKKGWLEMDLSDLQMDLSGTVVLGVEWLGVETDELIYSASCSFMAFGNSRSYVSAGYNEMEPYRGIGAYAIKAKFQFFD